jgi:transposase
MLDIAVPPHGLQGAGNSACLSFVVCGRRAGGRPGLALVEVSVVEQRYRAVLEVRAGVPVTEVAARAGVSRQSVHAWVRRYEQGGLGALADRSRRPESCPHQVSADIEAAVCEMRREHPKWGPLRLAHELGRLGVVPVPSRMSVYRVLVRHGLVEPGPRKRPRDSYLRWERDEPATAQRRASKHRNHHDRRAEDRPRAHPRPPGRHRPRRRRYHRRRPRRQHPHFPEDEHPASPKHQGRTVPQGCPSFPRCSHT